MMRFLHMCNPAMWSGITALSVLLASSAENWWVSTIASVAVNLILILSLAATYTKAPRGKKEAEQ